MGQDNSYLRYATLISLITEGLSLSRSLTFLPIVSFWIGALAINGGLIIYLYRNKRLLTPQFYFNKFKESIGQRRLSACLFGAIALVLFLTLVTALIAPPNNWDSMTYHMARVMNWIQNRSVEHYPTHILRQISLPPGAGYLVMHLQILAGGDYFANLVQWLAYFGCIVVTTLIVRRSTGPEQQEYQWLGGLITTSIPMAIMQSTTTQTDLIVSYWLVCFLYFIIQTDTYKRSDVIWIGFTLGLAILTKPTAYVFGLPIFCLFLLLFFKDKTPSFYTKIANLALLSALMLSILLPYYLRNYQLFGSPVGTDYGTRNEVFGIVPILSNLTRLIAINLPYQPWAVLEWLHNNLFLIDANDPRITFTDITPHQRPLLYLLPHEDYVSSSVNLGIILIGLVTTVHTFFTGNRKKDRQFYSLVLISQFCLILFCIILKFQPWSNRLLLPYFVISAPIFVQALPIWNQVSATWITSTLLSGIAVFYALTPTRHPLVPLPIDIVEVSPSILTLSREEIYFSAARRDIKEPYNRVVDALGDSKCQTVGLAIGEDDWEYPLWVLLKRTGDIRIVHTQVANPSRNAKTHISESDLCAVIATDKSYTNAQNLQKDMQRFWEYQLISQKPFMALYLKKEE